MEPIHDRLHHRDRDPHQHPEPPHLLVLEDAKGPQEQEEACDCERAPAHFLDLHHGEVGAEPNDHGTVHQIPETRQIPRLRPKLSDLLRNLPHQEAAKHYVLNGPEDCDVLMMQR